MSSSIWVKVVGFDDSERHSLNTMFRLSTRQSPSYVLWTSDAPSPPHVILLDMDSYEAGLELASPNFKRNAKFISVGSQAPKAAWRSFQRPVDWHAMVKVIDGLFGSQGDVDIDLGRQEPQNKTVPPGLRVSLLVGMKMDERLYLRARLALAGLTDVDEAESGTQARASLAKRHYDLVVVSLQLTDADPWALVQELSGRSTPPDAVLVATSTTTWVEMEKAEKAGCAGLLEIPFNPKQVRALLQQV